MVKDDYDDFERALSMKFKQWTFKGKNELKILMGSAGFHRKKIEGVTDSVPVSQKQINFAWDYYKSKLAQQELDLPKLFTIQRIGSRTIYRANREQEINGKVYRRGWFIPRPRK